MSGWPNLEVELFLEVRPGSSLPGAFFLCPCACLLCHAIWGRKHCEMKGMGSAERLSDGRRRDSEAAIH